MARAVLLHLSDVHVYDTLMGGGAVWHTNGHDIRAVEAFSRARRSIVNATAAKCFLIVSGDVSARGDRAELFLYQQFRDNGASLPGRLMARPFREGCHDLLDIPGNHDFWNGTPLPNPVLNRGVRNAFFGGPKSLIIQLKQWVVGIHGLCSTSGATANEQFWAVGAFDPLDLAILNGQVTRVDMKAARLGLKPAHFLVTHHSPSSGKPRLKGFAPQAAVALEDACNRLGIKGILTGHSHKWGLVPRGALPPEARSGTTIQGDTWIPWPKRQERAFLMHELVEVGERLRWCVTPWVQVDDPFQGYFFDCKTASKQRLAELS
jgi:hypothetical protein